MPERVELAGLGLQGRVPRRRIRRRRSDRGNGRWALTLGIAAVVCLIVPIVTAALISAFQAAS
jgi:hypothetical protein